MKISPLKPDDDGRLHLISELADSFKGEVAFVLGNGHSTTYYQPSLMRKVGYLIGCNDNHTKFDTHFQLFQDPGQPEKMKGYEGTLISPLVFKDKYKHIRFDNTFFFGFSYKRQKIQSLRLSSTGCLAMQFAARLGFNPIILVGCDCCFLMTEDNQWRSNIMTDRVRRLFLSCATRSQRELKRVDGKLTTNHFLRFRKDFRQSHHDILSENPSTKIYQMGKWGILEFESIEFEYFWSKDHPGLKEKED